jgi:hypothetical protein
MCFAVRLGNREARERLDEKRHLLGVDVAVRGLRDGRPRELVEELGRRRLRVGVADRARREVRVEVQDLDVVERVVDEIAV